MPGIAEAIGGAVSGLLGKAQDLRSAITGEITPDKQAEIAMRAQELEAALIKAQAEITKAEVQSPSIFIAGGRPLLLWICGLAVGMHYLVRPLLLWTLQLLGKEIPLYSLDLNTLWPVITAALGLGAYRTYEKVKGVQNKH